MKYELGDTVRIKVRKGTGSAYYESHLAFVEKNNYIATITQKRKGWFKLGDFNGWWTSDDIAEVITKPIIEPVTSRFEILDL